MALLLGTIMVLLFWRGDIRGRSARDFLGSSFSASEDELAEDDGLAKPSAMGIDEGWGIGGVVWLAGSDSSGAMLTK